ncbi:MAG: glycosyltransferase family 2 protein [Candidatus Omnitrophica bacterium]|nr:glycosyltransferase family 2 protein [Candidatus Omnitrophota bacterium]
MMIAQENEHDILKKRADSHHGAVVWRRIFEITPGFLSWFLLLAVAFFALTDPIPAAVFVICFYLFWFFRLIYMTILLVASYVVLARERNTNWIERCRDLNNVSVAIKRAQERLSKHEEEVKHAQRTREKVPITRRLHSETAYLRRLEHLAQTTEQPFDFRSIYHVVLFPNYREDIHILKSALSSLRETNYPLERLIVVVAFEEREGEAAHAKADELSREFKEIFFNLMTSFHPDGLPGERQVKGANATWAAKKVMEFLNEEKIAFEQVLVSCFDADTRVGKEYFGCLTYNFLIRPNRLHCSFQPIPVYHNNLWQAPAFARILETGSSYWQLIESANPDHLVTFSSHSMSFQALVESGFWPVDMISDDSAIFWKCFLHYKGNYRAIPMSATVSMNIIIGKNWLDTFRRIYVQKRRWAWGIENFPMVMLGFLETREIPLIEKARHTLKMLESHVSWATWGLMLTLVGWLPVLFGGREYGFSVVSYHLPRIAQMIFNLATVSMLISAILSFMIVPKRPARVSRFRNLSFAFQWLLLPLILPVLLALPALDAQTRLMLGRYLHFEVSRKV